MFRFNYDRTLVLDSVEKLPRGVLRIHTAFHGSVNVPLRSVRFSVTKYLNDSSVRVVDFGNVTNVQQATAAIVATSEQNRIPGF